VRCGIVGDHVQALRTRARGPQIQPAERQTRRAQVDVAVHESGRHEAAVEILDFGVGELTAADVIAAQPRDDVAAHGHGGGVGVGGLCTRPFTSSLVSLVGIWVTPQNYVCRAGGKTSGSTSMTSMTSPSM